MHSKKLWVFCWLALKVIASNNKIIGSESPSYAYTVKEQKLLYANPIYLFLH